MSAPQASAPQASASSVIDTLARTIYGEARGESVRGKEAIAAVVLNRVRRADERGGWWWGDSIEAVCRRPWQFSCWNDGDPNRALLDRLSDRDPNPNYATCRRIATRAVNGVLVDPTRGATHYHAKWLNPSWAKGRAPCAEIGRHLFYNDVE